MFSGVIAVVNSFTGPNGPFSGAANGGAQSGSNGGSSNGDSVQDADFEEVMYISRLKAK